jgi:hypothetical protein
MVSVLYSYFNHFLQFLKRKGTKFENRILRNCPQKKSQNPMAISFFLGAELSAVSSLVCPAGFISATLRGYRLYRG